VDKRPAAVLRVLFLEKKCFVGNNVRSELRFSISIKPQYFKLVINFLENEFISKHSTEGKDRPSGRIDREDGRDGKANGDRRQAENALE